MSLQAKPPSSALLTKTLNPGPLVLGVGVRVDVAEVHLAGRWGQRGTPRYSDPMRWRCRGAFAVPCLRTARQSRARYLRGVPPRAPRPRARPRWRMHPAPTHPFQACSLCRRQRSTGQAQVLGVSWRWPSVVANRNSPAGLRCHSSPKPYPRHASIIQDTGVLNAVNASGHHPRSNCGRGRPRTPIGEARSCAPPYAT